MLTLKIVVNAVVIFICWSIPLGFNSTIRLATPVGGISNKQQNMPLRPEGGRRIDLISAKSDLQCG